MLNITIFTAWLPFLENLDLADGGIKLLQNVGNHLPINTVSYLRSFECSEIEILLLFATVHIRELNVFRYFLSII